jgi:FkbM family methyltransferase
MKNQNVAIKIGNYLYNHCFGVYKVLYSRMKKSRDAIEISLMKQHIAKGDIVLDIGANIGFFSKILSKLVGKKGCIYAFEPDTENFAHLQKQTKHLSNVVLKKAAVSNKNEIITLYRSPMLNVDHRTYPIENYLSKEDIESIAIDNFLQKDTIVNFIKIDIQGFEYAAFQGMKEILTRNAEHLKMIMELWPAGLKKAGHSAIAVIELLWRHGYNTYLLQDKKQILLSRDAIEKMNDLGDEFYFNIFVRK